MKKIMTIMAVCCSFAFISCDNDKKETDSKEIAEDKNEAKFDNTKMENDAEFVTDVADGGMLEVKLGELAQTKAGSADVKELGKMLTAEHAKANGELAVAAAKNNITMASGLSTDNQKKYDDLAAKSGAEFDKDYTHFLKEAHEKTIKKIEDEIANGKNADIKAWATATLPVIKNHADMVNKVHDKVNK